MISKAEKLHLKALISDTVVTLCKNGLASKIKGQFSIEGLIGIRTEKDDLMLVNIREILPSSKCSTLDEIKKQPITKKRKRLSKKKFEENLTGKVAPIDKTTKSTTNNSGSLQETIISNQSTDDITGVTNVGEFNISSASPTNTSTQRSRRYSSRKSSTITKTVDGSLQQQANNSILSDSNDIDGVLTKRSKNSKRKSNEELSVVDISAIGNSSKQYKKSNNAISPGAEAYDSNIVHIKPYNSTVMDNARDVTMESVDVCVNLPGQSIPVSHINICPENEKNFGSDTTSVYVPCSGASDVAYGDDAVSDDAVNDDALSTGSREKSVISMKEEDTDNLNPKITGVAAEYNAIVVKQEQSFQEGSHVYPVLMIPVDQNVTSVSACSSQEYATKPGNYLDAEENEQDDASKVLGFNLTNDVKPSVADINIPKTAPTIAVKPPVVRPYNPPLSDIQFTKKIEPCIPFIPENTKCKTEWAMKLFSQWKEYHNAKAECDSTILPVLPNLENMTNDQINFSVSRFMWEVKKEDGSQYPGKSVYEIIASIQRYLCQFKPNLNFTTNPLFKQIQDSLDTLVKSRASKGIGMLKKQVDILTSNQTAVLKQKGLMGKSSPQVLLDTLFFKISLNFAIRSGSEHRSLSPGQLRLKIVDGKEVLQYTVAASKINPGGVKPRKLEPKVTCASEKADDLCLVKLHKLYLSKRPQDAPEDAYYLQAKRRVCENDDVWYTGVPVGHNALATTISRMCKTAGISGVFTNHSLRGNLSNSIVYSRNESPTPVPETRTLFYSNNEVERNDLDETRSWSW